MHDSTIPGDLKPTIAPCTGGLASVHAIAFPRSRSTGSEDLEIDAGRFAVACPVSDRATTEKACTSTIEWSAPDRAAARIYGCRKVDLVAIGEAVDEPS